MQTPGTDTISDYTEGEDTIQLLSTPISEGKKYNKSYQFVTQEGTVIVSNGNGKTITTVVSGSADMATADDELWGIDDAKDTFLFDGGNDTIQNYEEQDRINLGDYSLSDLVKDSPTVSKGNLIFTFDKSNSLTVSDVANSGTPVTFTDGTTYSYNGKRFVKN